MKLQFITLATTLLLTACLANEIAIPTLLPPTATMIPDSNFGIVTGKVCYPSTETPPMVLYLENSVTHDLTELYIERGQSTYRLDLPVGEYIAYAHTVGMSLRGTYPCADTDEPCPFQIEPAQITTIDLCGWYTSPGFRPPPPGQPDDIVWVKLLQNMHARTGPHLSYPETALVGAGTSLQAVGRTVDGEWVRVKHPALDQAGWLHAPLLQVIGDPGNLPVEVETSGSPLAQKQFIPAIWRSEHNRGIVLFKGEIRDEEGRLVNGFSILLDNGTWSVLSHPTGASHHYPDVLDGTWDVVIDNETDAAGWWTMTVVRYECPDFEIGFNAQCKQFTPLSETKVIRVTHPDENIIEANWTCLEKCDQGLYLKAYRHPVDPIPDNVLLYVEDRALKLSPASPAFDHIEMRTIYDALPETPDGLKAYLADNRPVLSPDGRYLVVNSPAPADVTWLADLETGDLHEISHPAESVAWSPDSRQIAYIQADTLYIFEISTHEATAIWQQADLVDPVLSWSGQITVTSGKTTWHISAIDQEATEVKTVIDSQESVADMLARRGLSPTAAWALSHDRQKVAYNVEVGGPLRNRIYIFDLKTQTQFLVGPINGYRVPELRWSAEDRLLVIGATNPKFPSGGAIFTIRPEQNVLPEILLESDTTYLVDVWPE